jgi:hypothetical protein
MTQMPPGLYLMKKSLRLTEIAVSKQNGIDKVFFRACDAAMDFCTEVRRFVDRLAGSISDVSVGCSAIFKKHLF